MAVLYHQVWIDAPPAVVYEAISTESGIGSWWDKPEAAQTEDGLILEFRPGPQHGVLRAKVLEMKPHKRVEWAFISTHPAASPASAWTGTHASFELSKRKTETVLDFRHSRWDKDNKYFGFCNFAWGVALQKLQQYCESMQSR